MTIRHPHPAPAQPAGRHHRGEHPGPTSADRHPSRTPPSPPSEPQGRHPPGPAGQGSGQLDVPRLLGRVDGADAGPTLVAIGGLHGNEPAGVLALQRVLAALEEDAHGLAGTLVGLSGNRSSLREARRYIDEDLNRIWKPERLRRARDGSANQLVEERELAELDGILDAIIRQARGPIAFLDLHSTSGGGSPFTTLDDTLGNRVLAFGLPVTHVLGLEEELTGTLLSHLDEVGLPAIGFEAGQHDDPASVDRAEAAVWIVMESASVLEPGARAEVQRSRELLEASCRACPHVVEVRHRHALELQNDFTMLEGFASFQPVREGEQLAVQDGRPVLAPMDGLMLMPLYQTQGDDGFFIVGRVRSAWLMLSTLLRWTRLDRIAHWLPGVTRDPDEADTFLIDRRRARWLALEIFHLLGFKRRGTSGTTLRMSRRIEARRGGPDAARARQ